MTARTRRRTSHGSRPSAGSGALVTHVLLFLREMTVAGMGLALLPADAVAKDVDAGRLVRVLPRYGLGGGGVYLVWPRGAPDQMPHGR